MSSLPWVMSAADATPTELLTDAIANLAAAAQHINEAAQGTLGELPWEVAATMLRTLRAIVTDHLGPLDASLVRHLYMTAPHGDTELEGVGVIGVRRSHDRKQWESVTWQHDVRGAVTDKYAAGNTHLYDLDGNEYNLLDLLAQAQNVHGAQAPKVTALRALGLDPAAYCEERPGKPTVEFK